MTTTKTVRERETEKNDRVIERERGGKRVSERRREGIERKRKQEIEREMECEKVGVRDREGE